MASPLFVGIEIGGTKLQLGVGRGDGKLLALERREADLAAGAVGIRAQIAGAMAPLLERVGVEAETIAAVGIGFGGPVDAGRGMVTTSNQVPGWDGFPLTTWVRETFGIHRVCLQNDADTAGLGEARFGAGQGHSPLLYVTIGSGIGGGLIIDGKIYRGSGAGAIEVGHLWVIDRSDSDLGFVTLEKAASGWAIAAAARAFIEPRLAKGQLTNWPPLVAAGGDPTAITARAVGEAAQAGDKESLLILDRATTAMAHGLAQSVTLLAPHRIILGGGVSLIGEVLWFGPIRQKLAALVFPPFRGQFDVVPAALGEEVVVHGALALAHDLTIATD